MEKSYTNLLQLLKNPIPIKGKKIQMKVHAGNSNKAIGSSRMWTSNKKTTKRIQFFFMPSKLIDRSKAKNKGIMPSKLIDRSKAKNRGIMPSKLIGPPIIRWKEKKRNKNIITYCTRLNIIVINLS